MRQSYTPPDHILEKYAELLVKFGMTNQAGKKLPKGSVIEFVVPEVAKPLYFHLQTAILKAGYHPLGVFLPDNDLRYNIEKNFYDHANTHQLNFFPEQFTRGLVDQVDGYIRVIADVNPQALNEVEAKKVMQKAAAKTAEKKWRFEKIDADKMAWTLGLYGTEAGAKEAGMSLKSYWNQIIKACYLDETDPVTTWQHINKTIQQTADKLTNIQIKEVHVVGNDMDITIGIGKDRVWKAAGGYNVPSYEVFTSPNCHQINGWIKFNQPHFRYGKMIEGIELTFKDGKVVKYSATKNETLLKQMIKTKGGNMAGEFSLTDARLSRITKFMAEILYDENMGGKYGNTHIAIGSAYRECYNGSGSKKTDAQWQTLGFNDSVVHSDFISTTDRTVTATLYDGTSKVIYKKGQFTI